MFNIKPANEKLLNGNPEIRVSESEDKIVIYAPFNWNIKLRLNETIHKWEGIELVSRRVFKPTVEISSDHTTIKMSNFNADILLIGLKI